MAMRNSRTANCIFCDDVRQEVGNKFSLMGIYNADIFVGGAKPVALPKFVIAVWVVSDIDDPIQDIAIRVLVPPDGHEAARAEIRGLAPDPVRAEGATRRSWFSVIPISPFVLSDEGFIEVMVDTESGSLRAGRLMVHFADQPAVAATIPVG